MTIIADRINTIYLSPKEYMNLSIEEKNDIENCETIPAQLGRANDFGQFKVKFKDFSIVYKLRQRLGRSLFVW